MLKEILIVQLNKYNQYCSRNDNLETTDASNEFEMVVESGSGFSNSVTSNLKVSDVTDDKDQNDSTTRFYFKEFTKLNKP